VSVTVTSQWGTMPINTTVYRGTFWTSFSVLMYDIGMYYTLEVDVTIESEEAVWFFDVGESCLHVAVYGRSGRSPRDGTAFDNRSNVHIRSRGRAYLSRHHLSTIIIIANIIILAVGSGDCTWLKI
jgi:hypothetical protein